MTSRTTVGVLWQVIRLPVFVFLAILEPVVHFVLYVLALAFVLMAFFLEFFTELPDFPFWGMLAMGVGCGFLLVVYYALMRLFSR